VLIMYVCVCARARVRAIIIAGPSYVAIPSDFLSAQAAEALESFAKDKGEALSASARTPSMLAAAPLVATVPYYLHWASKPS
jgi:hypothetical protein